MLPENALLLEIGPGTGNLTRQLIEDHNHLECIEIDQRAVEVLGEKFPTLPTHNKDVLTFDLTGFARERKKQLVIVGNLPYNITSPILFHLLDHRAVIDNALLMVQDEVARRLNAKKKTKEYGIMSVQLQVFSEVTYLFKVPRTVFKPQPRVDSAIVQLNFEERELPCRFANLKKVVRTAFNQRRKTMRNALKPLIGKTHELDEQLGLHRRAEELAPAEYVKMTAVLEQHDILT